ncbi:hypothetical protein [Peribacillus sp. SCS-155]|uniref:hypothetical protein n=1 Tax=Peribacillus sedimenti TaxID=3115297 RepID=UPI003906A568
MNYEVSIKEACTSNSFWSCLEPADWFQFASAIIAIVSAGIALYTVKKSWEAANKQLKETAQQRIDTFRPELFIKYMQYHFCYDRKKVNPSVAHGVFSNILEVNPDYKPSNLYLNIKNIGEYPAKKIQINWDFEISKCIEFIKATQNKKQYIISFQEGYQVIFRESSTTYLKEDLNCYFPYCFEQGEDTKITLPYSYTKILSILIHLYIDEKEFLNDNIPKLKLSLTFEDVLKNQFPPKVFTIKPHFEGNSLAKADDIVISYDGKINLQIEEVS